MKYIVRENEYPMEFSDEQKNTAITVAEALVKKGRKVTIEIIDHEEPKKDIVEVTRCPDCSLYKSYVNPSGRFVEFCSEHEIEVNGDFYCPLGGLNRKED